MEWMYSRCCSDKQSRMVLSIRVRVTVMHGHVHVVGYVCLQGQERLLDVESLCLCVFRTHSWDGVTESFLSAFPPAPVGKRRWREAF